MDWLPIETAPKDGTIVLLGGGTYGDDYLPEALRVMAARWEKFERWDEGDWFVCIAEGGYSCFSYENPTHWMPLPEPPAASAGKER